MCIVGSSVSKVKIVQVGSGQLLFTWSSLVGIETEGLLRSDLVVWRVQAEPGQHGSRKLAIVVCKKIGFVRKMPGPTGSQSVFVKHILVSFMRQI